MARVFYIEEIGLVILKFTMFSHRTVQTVSVFIINGLFIVPFLYTKSYHIICYI